MLATKGYGLSVDDIDWSCPADMEPYLKAHKEELKEKDYLAWIQGQYTLSAVSVAIEHCFAGKKAKTKYIEETILSKALENEGLTEHEIQEKKIKKAILIEQQYMARAINNRLPETIIK